MLTAQDILLIVQCLVAGELDKPMLAGLLIGQYCIRVQQAIDTLRHQQLGRLTTGARRPADGRALFVGIFQKVLIATDHVLTREPQWILLIQRLYRFLDPQIADGAGVLRPSKYRSSLKPSGFSRPIWAIKKRLAAPDGAISCRKVGASRDDNESKYTGRRALTA